MIVPKYPVIYIGKHSLDVYGSKKTASTVGSVFIENEWWKEKELIDFDGNMFLIKGIRVLGNGSWWPHKLTIPARRIYSIQYNYLWKEKLEFERIKLLVISKLRSSHEPWKYVEECNSLEELFNEIGIQP